MFRHTKVFERNRHQKYLSYIEISIADHCNLNCARCSNFSPLAQEHFADIDIFDTNIKKLTEISNKRIDEIRLIGGEPLLNPKILDYFDIIKKHLPHTDMSFTTNGILLSKQSDLFFQYISDNKVKIFISDYSDDGKKFNNMSINKDGTYDSELNYEECSFSRTCLHMRDDIIYICPMVAHLEHFKKYFNEELKLTEQDYIKVNELDSLEQLMNFINEPKTNSFCKHCNLKNRENLLFDVEHTSYGIYEWYYKETGVDK